MAWQPAKNPYSKQQQVKQPIQQPQQQNEEESEIVGYCDLFESNPDYASVMYGTMAIPLQLIADAVDSGDVKEIRGQESVVLSVTIYEYDREWKFDTQPPMLKAYVKRKKKKQGQDKPIGQRRRF